MTSGAGPPCPPPPGGEPDRAAQSKETDPPIRVPGAARQQGAPAPSALHGQPRSKPWLPRQPPHRGRAGQGRQCLTPASARHSCAEPAATPSPAQDRGGLAGRQAHPRDREASLTCRVIGGQKGGAGRRTRAGCCLKRKGDALASSQPPRAHHRLGRETPRETREATARQAGLPSGRRGGWMAPDKPTAREQGGIQPSLPGSAASGTHPGTRRGPPATRRRGAPAGACGGGTRRPLRAGARRPTRPVRRLGPQCSD